MSTGSGGVLEVEPAELRAAASRVDGVFSEANDRLSSTDREIADSSGAWTDTATAAFAQFTTYVDRRRDALLEALVQLSDGLVVNADRYDHQDDANAEAIDRSGQAINQ